MPLLQTIHSENFDVLSIILKIASGSCELNQFSPELFDQWEPLLLPLLRQTLDGKVVFVGYYGFLIIGSCEYNENILEIKMPKSFNTFPIPALWCSSNFLHEVLKDKPNEVRVAANKLTDEIFKKYNSDQSLDFGNDISFNFFLTFFDDKKLTNDIHEVTPYLLYLKLIRNAVAHIKSLKNINDISRHLPVFLNEWVRILLEMFFPRNNNAI
jgi:hypothetical protein